MAAVDDDAALMPGRPDDACQDDVPQEDRRLSETETKMASLTQDLDRLLNDKSAAAGEERSQQDAEAKVNGASGDEDPIITELRALLDTKAEVLEKTKQWARYKNHPKILKSTILREFGDGHPDDVQTAITEEAASFQHGLDCPCLMCERLFKRVDMETAIPDHYRCCNGEDLFRFKPYDFDLAPRVSETSGRFRIGDILVRIFEFLPLCVYTLTAISAVDKAWRFYANYLPHWQFLLPMKRVVPAIFSQLRFDIMRQPDPKERVRLYKRWQQRGEKFKMNLRRRQDENGGASSAVAAVGINPMDAASREPAMFAEDDDGGTRQSDHDGADRENRQNNLEQETTLAQAVSLSIVPASFRPKRWQPSRVNELVQLFFPRPLMDEGEWEEINPTELLIATEMGTAAPDPETSCEWVVELKDEPDTSDTETRTVEIDQPSVQLVSLEILAEAKRWREQRSGGTKQQDADTDDLWQSPPAPQTDGELEAQTEEPTRTQEVSEEIRIITYRASVVAVHRTRNDQEVSASWREEHLFSTRDDFCDAIRTELGKSGGEGWLPLLTSVLVVGIVLGALRLMASFPYLMGVGLLLLISSRLLVDFSVPLSTENIQQLAYTYPRNMHQVVINRFQIAVWGFIPILGVIALGPMYFLQYADPLERCISVDGFDPAALASSAFHRHIVFPAGTQLDVTLSQSASGSHVLNFWNGVDSQSVNVPLSTQQTGGIRNAVQDFHEDFLCRFYKNAVSNCLASVTQTTQDLELLVRTSSRNVDRRTLELRPANAWDGTSAVETGFLPSSGSETRFDGLFPPPGSGKAAITINTATGCRNYHDRIVPAVKRNVQIVFYMTPLLQIITLLLLYFFVTFRSPLSRRMLSIVGSSSCFVAFVFSLCCVVISAPDDETLTKLWLTSQYNTFMYVAMGLSGFFSLFFGVILVTHKPSEGLC